MNNTHRIDDAEVTPALDLHALHWMAGAWMGSIDGDPIEEHWSTAAGDTMMGMFRWLKDQQVYLYEFIVISNSELGTTLQIKHFRPDLVGWEEKDSAITYFFQSLEGQSVTFGNAKFGDESRVLQYTLNEQGQLIVTLYSSENGEPKNYEFIYSRP